MPDLEPIRRTPRIEVKDIHPCATALSVGQVREISQLAAILGQSRAAYTRSCIEDGLVLVEGGTVEMRDYRISNKSIYSHVKVHGEILRRIDVLVERFNSNRRHVLTFCILVGLEQKKKLGEAGKISRSETIDARLSRLEDAMGEVLEKLNLKPLRDRI